MYCHRSLLTLHIGASLVVDCPRVPSTFSSLALESRTHCLALCLSLFLSLLFLKSYFNILVSGKKLCLLNIFYCVSEFWNNQWFKTESCNKHCSLHKKCWAPIFRPFQNKSVQSVAFSSPFILQTNNAHKVHIPWYTHCLLLQKYETICWHKSGHRLHTCTLGTLLQKYETICWHNSGHWLHTSASIVSDLRPTLTPTLTKIAAIIIFW